MRFVFSTVLLDEDQESWIVHIGGDEDHSETAFKVVLDNCTMPELQQMMLWCIDEYTLGQFLAGLRERRGLHP